MREYTGSQREGIKQALKMAHKSGYYVCEIEYGMLRVVCWYDERTELFKTADDWAGLDEFTYISREPLNLNEMELLPVDVWAHIDNTENDNG